MDKVFNKIVSILMAFIVLFSTMSFTIDMHYCGDSLVDTGVFRSAKSCGMEMETSTKDCSIKKKNCCSKKQIAVEGQDELNISFDNLSLDQQLFIVSFIYTNLNKFEIKEEKLVSFNNYPPPNVVRHIYKLDETYLI